MSVGQALLETWRRWRRAAPGVIAAALVVVLPLEVLIAVFDPANDVSPHRGLHTALYAGTNLVALPWVAGAVTRYLNDGGSALRAYGRLPGALAGLIIGSFLAFLGIVVGLVLVIIPGLVAAARWSLLVPVAVLEQRGPIAVLGRSNELVKGATGRVLAVMAIIVLAGIVIVAIPIIASELLWPGFVASLVLGLSVDLLLVPLATVAAYVVYRARTETA
jgi:hypothetical protein